MARDLAAGLQCTEVMRLGTNPPEYRYKMGDVDLEETLVEKDLGVMTDNRLRFRKQAESVAGKANKIIGLIRSSQAECGRIVGLYVEE